MSTDFDRQQAEVSLQNMRLNEDIMRQVFRWLVSDVSGLNYDKGWFDRKRSVGDMVALLHAEVSEVLEAFRDHGMTDATKDNPPGFESATPKPEGIGAEMADVLIRLLDMAYRWDIDLVAEYKRKMAYNWTRPYRHGRKEL